MRQVMSWTFGSFFRTIGKVIAFFVLGCVAAYFFATHDIKLPNIFRFVLMQVNALSLDGQFDRQVQVSNSDMIVVLDNYNKTSDVATTNFDYSVSNGNSTYIVFPVTGITYTTNEYDDLANPNYFHNVLEAHILIYLKTNKGWNHCEWQNNFIVCPVFLNSTITGLQYNFYTGTSWSASDIELSFRVGAYGNLYHTDTSAIIESQNQNTQAITNQTQQAQEQHEELMDTNMTETNETATSFFSSFDNDDIGGLSGIITAPLVMINSMLSGTCVQPSATWKGATISLPCGDMLWSRNGASDLKNLLNVFYGGFICYYAIRKLFLMVEGMKDPTNDRIEVSDL